MNQNVMIDGNSLNVNDIQTGTKKILDFLTTLKDYICNAECLLSSKAEDNTSFQQYLEFAENINMKEQIDGLLTQDDNVMRILCKEFNLFNLRTELLKSCTFEKINNALEEGLLYVNIVGLKNTLDLTLNGVENFYNAHYIQANDEMNNTIDALRKAIGKYRSNTKVQPKVNNFQQVNPPQVNNNIYEIANLASPNFMFNSTNPIMLNNNVMCPCSNFNMDMNPGININQNNIMINNNMMNPYFNFMMNSNNINAGINQNNIPMNQFGSGMSNGSNMINSSYQPNNLYPQFNLGK